MEDSRSWVAVVFLGLFSLFAIRLYQHFKARPNLPPSPMALPILGHLHLISSSIHRSLYKLSLRLGPLFYARLGSVPFLVVSDAAMAREILRNQEHCFSNRYRTDAIRYVTYGDRSFIFSPYGEYWKFMKKLCLAEVLGDRTLERLQWVRREEMRRLLEMMYQKAEKREEVDIAAALRRLSNNAICGMTMGRRCSGTDAEAREVKKLVEETVALIGSPLLSDFVKIWKSLGFQRLNPRYKDLHCRFDNLMERIVGEEETLRTKESAKAESGLLSVLLDISQDHGGKMELTRESIKSFIKDLFFGGTDTTSVAIEWAFAEMINHPEIMLEARKEIDSMVGSCRLVEESDIPKLPFLQAIVKETLRLHPATPVFPREANAPCKFKGYDIAAGTKVVINIWAMGRDPDQWEKPLEFRPERFMAGGQSFGVDIKGLHYQFIPFGSGRRRCPGISLALKMIHMTVANVIHCFDLIVEGGVVDMTEGGFGATLTRAQPLVCALKTRLNPTAC